MNHLLLECNDLLKVGGFDYAFCGGYAIELFLNKPVRKHGDIDISVYWDERDKIILFMQSLGWCVYELCGGGMAHYITDVANQIKAKRNIFCMTDDCKTVSLKPTDEQDMFIVDFDPKGQDKLTFIEFLFNNKNNDRFLYARNHDISLPLSQAVLTRNGIKYLAPEMVLLYKSTDTEREGYQLDYDSAIQAMSSEQKDWLKNALKTMNPDGHKWLCDKNIVYRQMVREDIDLALAGFGNQNWDKPRKVLETYFNEQEQGKRKVIVAESDGEIAGYVTLLPSARGGTFKKKGTPEVCDFIVFQKFQRQGIGTELMNHIETEAAKLSDTVCLGVGMHSGYGAAQRLYIKRGYVPDGSGIWYERSQAQQYGTIENNDALVLYMSKELKFDVKQAGFWIALDSLITKSEIIIDRPKGTKHPHFDFIFPLDYGYLKDTSSMDGGGIDVWCGSVSDSVCDAVICTVDLLKKDSEIKLLIGCTEEEKAIIMRFHNESEYMKGAMIRREME